MPIIIWVILKQSQSLLAGTGKIIATIKTSLPQTKIMMAATIAPNSVAFGNGLSNLYFTAMDKIEKTNTIKLYLDNFIAFSQNQLPWPMPIAPV